MTTLVLRVEPASTAKYFHLLPENKTITELVALVREIPSTAWTHGRVYIGGVEFPRSWWDRVRVKSGVALSLTIEPQGGGDGGAKDIISTVALIGVIAAGAFVSAGALAPFLGGAFLGGTFGAQAAALGITVVGQLAISALAPPPTAPNLDASAVQVREVAGVTGNPLSRRDYVPRVLGKMRVSPPHVMFPFTELEGGEVVASAMVGLAGAHSIDDIWINNAPIDDFTGITYEVRNGFSTDTQIELFDGKSGVEQGVGTALTNFALDTSNTALLLDQTNPENSYPKYQTFKTRGITDEFKIRLFWPAGMTSQNTNRALQPIALQLRLAGSDTWINGPEFWFSEKDAVAQQMRQEISLIFTAVPSLPANASINTDNIGTFAYGDTPNAYNWKPNSYFAPSSGYYAENVATVKDGFDVYLDPLTFPKGEYEVRIKRGLQIAYGTWTASTYVWSVGSIDFYETRDVAAPYESDNNQDDQSGNVIVETVLTKSDDYPFTQQNLTLIAVKAVGVKVESISADFTSWAKTRDSIVYHFDDNIEDFTSFNSTLTVSDSVLSHPADAANPALLSPTGLEINGTNYQFIRMRLKRTRGSDWIGFVYWGIDNDPLQFTKSVSISEPAGIDNDFVIATWDMSDVAGTGDNWVGNTIGRFQFNLGSFSNADNDFDIDWISVGVADADDWIENPTINPAAIYRHVLSSSLNSRALPESVIDDDELKDWYERCLNKGYECNFITQQYSVDQCKQIIASAGWALPQQSEKWGVIQERDLSADAPSQLFTQRNSKGMVTEKAFSDLPHAIVAEFFDIENNYLQSEELVYFPGYNAANATLFESIRYDGITRRSKARERAQLDIDQLIYRQSKYVLETDISHLVSPRGSLVAVSNDFLSKIYDSAFIKSVTTSTGNITGLVLDGAVKIEAYTIDVFSEDNIFSPSDIFGETSASAVTIQENDGSTLTLDIDETADTSTITLSTPLADPGTIEAGLMVAIGRPGQVVKRCKIFNVERVSDFNARLTLVDEAPEIHQ